MVAKTRTSKSTKKEKPVEKKTRGRKPKTTKPVKEVKPKTVQKKITKERAPRVKKSEIQLDESLAVDCCAELKKSITSGTYKNWEEIGTGEMSKMWFQIKGLREGNNIAISKEGEGRKKKYMLYLLSLQGTEVECEFDTFIYKHSKGSLELIFTLTDKIEIHHKVKYGEIDG